MVPAAEAGEVAERGRTVGEAHHVVELATGGVGAAPREAAVAVTRPDDARQPLARAVDGRDVDHQGAAAQVAPVEPDPRVGVGQPRRHGGVEQDPHSRMAHADLAGRDEQGLPTWAVPAGAARVQGGWWGSDLAGTGRGGVGPADVALLVARRLLQEQVAGCLVRRWATVGVLGAAWRSGAARHAIVETCLRDRPDNDVAAELGVSVSTLRSRVFHGLRHLRTAMTAMEAR